MEVQNEEFDEGSLYYNDNDYNFLRYEDGREEQQSPSGLRENPFPYLDNGFMPQEEVENEQNQESEVDQQNASELEHENKLDSDQQYTPQTIDTDTLIKPDVKQFIFTQVAEEMVLKSLNDRNNEIEEQIENLKGREDELQTKIKAQDFDVERDNRRLLQCEATLSKTKEMINSLCKENVEPLEAKLQRCTIKDIYEKVNDQYNKMKAIKTSFSLEIQRKNEKIQEMTDTWIDRNEHLKSEVDYLQTILDDYRRKHEEVKNNTLSYSEEIDMSLKKKQILEQKLDELKNRRGLKYKKITNDIEKDKKQIQKQHLTKTSLLKRSDKLKNAKLDLKKQLEECLSAVDVLKTNVSAKREETKREETRLDELKNQLDAANVLATEKVQNRQHIHENIYSQLCDRKAELLKDQKKNSEQKDTLNELKIEIMKKCENKLELSQKILKQQSDFHSLNTQLVELQREKGIKRTKFEELRTQYDVCLASLKSLREQISQEKEKSDQKLEEAKIKYELFKEKNNQILNELKKKLQLSQSTYNCLMEKSEKVKKELTESETSYEHDEESNASLKTMIEQEQNVVRIMKEKLNLLNRKPIEPAEKFESKLSQQQKLTKKVTFKETPSFKSTTESETSSQQPLPQQNPKQKPRENDWLQGFESESDENNQQDSQEDSNLLDWLEDFGTDYKKKLK